VQKFMKLGAVLMLFGALLVAGCGGDDDESSDSGETTEALSAEEYSTTVTDALTQFGTEFAALGEAVKNPESPEAYVAGVEDIQARLDEIIAELEGVTPPPEGEQVHADLIAAFEDLNASFTPVIETAQNAEDDPQALIEAATDLQAAALDFQTEATRISEEAAEAGIPLE
jgi:hypothetical protein